MEIVMEYLPFLIPAALVQLGLLITALVSILRRRTYRAGNRVFWIVIVVIFGILGPILYFAIGRSDT